MFKRITEDVVKEKTKIFLEQRRWRKVCLLVLSLLPKGKWASRYFIYTKIKDWGFWDLAPNIEIDDRKKDSTATCCLISTALYNLHIQELLKKEDLSRMRRSDFEKFCRAKVLGETEQIIFTRGVQSVFKLSLEGKKRVKETLFPPKKNAFKNQPRSVRA